MVGNDFTLGELLGLWVEDDLIGGKLATGTVNNYMSTVRTLQRLPIGARPAADITTEELEAFLETAMTDRIGADGRVVRGYSRSHILSFSAVLHHAFRFALRRGLVERDPACQMGVPSTPACGFDMFEGCGGSARRRTEALGVGGRMLSTRASSAAGGTVSHATYLRICDRFRETNNAALLPVQISYYTGLRLGEVCALLWDDVNLRGGWLDVRRSLTLNRIHDSFLEFTPPKRNHARRVFFGDTLRAILQQAREQQAVRAACGTAMANYCVPFDDAGKLRYRLESLAAREEVPAGWRRLDLVCTRADGSFENRRTLASACYRVRDKVPGAEGFHFHQLRHAYTTNLIAAKVSPKTVQELLGHNDIATTMNVYAHTNARSLRRAARALDKL